MGVDPGINMTGSNAETWAGEEHNKRRKGEEVLHIPINLLSAELRAYIPGSAKRMADWPFGFMGNKKPRH